jgi:hypothetical protein
MKLIFTITLFIALFNSLNWEGLDSENLELIPHDLTQVDTNSITIIPFDTTLYWIFKNAKQAQLNNKDLETIDKLLTQCINEDNLIQRKRYEQLSNQFPNNNYKLSDFVINLNNYKKQLIPITNAKGEKEVYINCFCVSRNNNWNNNWKTDLIMVDDGGNCFFQLKVNINQKKYYDLMVNGNA